MAPNGTAPVPSLPEEQQADWGTFQPAGGAAPTQAASKPAGTSAPASQSAAAQPDWGTFTGTGQPTASTKPASTRPASSIGPAPKVSDEGSYPSSANMLDPSGVVSGAAQKLTMPLIKALTAVHDKLKDVQNYTEEGKAAHPVQAWLGNIADGVEGFLTGGSTSHKIGTGETGMLTNPITGMILPGPEGVPAAYTGIEEGVTAINSEVKAAQAARAARTASKGPGYVQNIMQGEKVAQAPATAALRQAGIEASGGTDIALPSGKDSIRLLLEDPIADAKFAGQHDKAAALQELETKVFKNPSIVSGNAEHQVDEVVNVKSAINALQKMHDTPGGSRLELALGRDGAHDLLGALYKAQAAGEKAVKARDITGKVLKAASAVGTVGGAVTAAYELSKNK